MIWRNLWNRLRGEPQTLASEIDEEIAFHLEMRERELREKGWPEADAKREARKSIGNLTLAREDARAAWRFTWLDDFVRDLRYGARMLVANPGFTVASVFALTIGIGLNTVWFNVYNAFAFAPWSIRDAGQTVQLFAGTRGEWAGISWPHYRYLAEHATTMESAAGWTSTGVRISRGAETWSAFGMAVSENYFDVLGTGFAFGRGFTPLEADPSKPAPQVVLHHDVWRTRYGADPSIVGQWIEINGRQLQVIGVAAEGFSGPTPVAPQLWIPAGWRDIFHPEVDSINNPRACCTDVIFRLKPKVPTDKATAEITTLSAQFKSNAKLPHANYLLRSPSILANPSIASQASVAFSALWVAMLSILLLACANVANLHLSRAGARKQEIAVRLSLGAKRSRIIRQLLAESLLIGVLAAGLSLALSHWAPGWIVQNFAAPDEKITFRFENDWRVLLFIAGATLTATLLVGLSPAVHAVRATGLAVPGTRVTGSSRFRSVLLGVQVTLCVVLLCGAALLARGFDRARHIDMGFRSDDVIHFAPHLESSGVDDKTAVRLLSDLLEQIRALPGVTSAAHASWIPMTNWYNGTRLEDPTTKQQFRVGVVHVSAGYFETLGLSLRSGRAFGQVDEARTDIVIVSQALASRLWPDQPALGRPMNGPDNRPLEVVGVVADCKLRDLASPREYAIYLPSSGTRSSTVVLRHAGDAQPLLAALPKLARDLDSRFLPSIEPYSVPVQKARNGSALTASIAGFVSLLALVLACVGIAGVVSYDVTRRRREIGIRMALGAHVGAILQQVLWRNLRAVAVGAVAGIGGALIVGRFLESMLYGVSPSDPVALLFTLVSLGVVALIAAWAPARRAARVDPALTLRQE